MNILKWIKRGVIIVVGTAAAYFGVITAASAQPYNPVYTYFNSCQSSSAWQHATSAERNNAIKAMNFNYGDENSAWNRDDLKHAYQGTRNNLSHRQPGIHIDFLHIDGQKKSRDTALGAPSTACYV